MLTVSRWEIWEPYTVLSSADSNLFQERRSCTYVNSTGRQRLRHVTVSRKRKLPVGAIHPPVPLQHCPLLSYLCRLSVTFASLLRKTGPARFQIEHAPKWVCTVPSLLLIMSVLHLYILIASLLGHFLRHSTGCTVIFQFASIFVRKSKVILFKLTEHELRSD
jgi:hypothetical protein